MLRDGGVPIEPWADTSVANWRTTSVRTNEAAIIEAAIRQRLVYVLPLLLRCFAFSP